MDEFTKTDYKALHILATYISENFINTNIRNAFTITPADICNYRFFWENSYCNTINKKTMTNHIAVPRYLYHNYGNTKLEAILQYGYEIFKLINDYKQRNENWFRYFLEKIFCKIDSTDYTYELFKFFRILQSANKHLLDAYNNYPDKPVEWEKIDKIFITHQSHIFLVSSLFELYHPLSVL